jgi:hypothetical protein
VARDIHPAQVEHDQIEVFAGEGDGSVGEDPIRLEHHLGLERVARRQCLLRSALELGQEAGWRYPVVDLVDRAIADDDTVHRFRRPRCPPANDRDPPACG